MKVKNPGQLKSYFILEKKNLLIVMITGIVYNIGMTAGPYFEGRLAQCLLDISRGQKTWKNMFLLAVLYVLTILIIQTCRGGKRFFVRRFANETSRNMRHMLYNSIVHRSKQELEKEELGAVMTKAVSDVDACVEGMRKFTTEVFDTGVVMISYAVLLCIYDFKLAVLSCMLIPLAYFIAGKCRKIVTRYNSIYKKSAEKLNQSAFDMVSNVLSYRVLGQESNRMTEFEKDLAAYEKTAVNANIWESTMQPIYYVIAMCGGGFIFYFGSRNVLGVGWKLWDIGAFTTISMAADSLKVVSILVIVFMKSLGLGIVLCVTAPLIMWITIVFQSRMRSAQIHNRQAIAKVNHHVPETIMNIRAIHTYACEDIWRTNTMPIFRRGMKQWISPISMIPFIHLL